MLESLSINNIVLIDKLNINLSKGLCILTGETGSGKSILLDALGLAIGFRSNIKLLRSGENIGFVVANFDISTNKKCQLLLKEHSIDFENNIIIRRTISSDGKSKSFINDIQVTQSFLQNIGETLVEIHGQNEQIGLLNSSFHRDILDDFGNLNEKKQNLASIYEKMKNSKQKLKELLDKKENNEREQDYLKHIIGEISSLNLSIGEEKELSDKRVILMNKEKLFDILKSTKETIENQYNVSQGILSAEHFLSRSIALGENLLKNGENAFNSIIENLDIASDNINEAISKIESIFDSFGFEEESLEVVEERLFAIRSLARKLNTQPDLILDMKKKFEDDLNNLQNQETIIDELENEVKKLKESYLKYATELSNDRKKVAKILSKNIIEELAPLKMEKTVFDVEFKELNEENWSKNGIDSIKFVASTNPGMPLSDLSKIASGGELSRFMLAFKVVLLETNSVPTMVFDEIDTGISGAVADAVGFRLKKLSEKLQVLVVTHLPQIASKGTSHFKVQKIQNNDKTNTDIRLLNNDERIEEIARMLSGENITDDALKLAKEMLK